MPAVRSTTPILAPAAGVPLFFQKVSESENTMKITDEQANELFKVHDALWNAVYDRDSTIHNLAYKGNDYTIQIANHKGYASVMLPNSKGIKFMWITQNLNKSTYGTLAINKARNENQDHRITWIVDTRNGGFAYRSNITTTFKDGQMIYGTIEIYDDFGKKVVWSTNKSFITRQAEF
jgi:hypothetical protein